MLMASGFHCRGWCVCIESAGQRGMRSHGESGHWVPLEFACSSADCPPVLSWTSHPPSHTVHCKGQKEIVLMTPKQVDLAKQQIAQHHYLLTSQCAWSCTSMKRVYGFNFDFWMRPLILAVAVWSNFTTYCSASFGDKQFWSMPNSWRTPCIK